MNLKNITLALLLLVGSGCASLTQEGSLVRLAKQVGADCTFIGSANVPLMTNGGDNYLKNHAANMGGNWVVVTGYKFEGAFQGNKPSSGEIYSCPTTGGSARIVNKTIDLNVNSRSTSSINNNTGDSNAFQKLEKLKKLKDAGVITNKDFEIKKQELLKLL